MINATAMLNHDIRRIRTSGASLHRVLQNQLSRARVKVLPARVASGFFANLPRTIPVGKNTKNKTSAFTRSAFMK